MQGYRPLSPTSRPYLWSRHQEVAIDAKIGTLAACFHSDIWCQMGFSRTSNGRTLWKMAKLQRPGLVRNLEAGLKVAFPSKKGFHGGLWFSFQFLHNSQHFIMGKAIFITGAWGKVQLFYRSKLILWIQFEYKGQASWGNPSFLAFFSAPIDLWRELASMEDSWSGNAGV